MELTNRRTIWVSKEWFEQLEAYTEPDERITDHTYPFNSMRFLTPAGKVVVFVIDTETDTL
jgi:hypothetical protein